MAFNRIRKLFVDKELNNKKPPFTIMDSDIFLVSYPKSGNTWVRFLLSNYLCNECIDFNNSNLIIPDIHYNPEQVSNLITSPRFIKSHYDFRPEYKNVIYIIRDGRDVAVSYYYFQKMTNEIDENMSFETYFYEIFLTGKSLFGEWGKHVNSWRNTKSNVLLIKYETLHDNTENAFKSILKFCDLPTDSEKINKALMNSTYESMKQIESINHELFFKERKIKDTGYGFMRKGEKSDWKNHFSNAMVKAFNDRYSYLMYELGYII